MNKITIACSIVSFLFSTSVFAEVHVGGYIEQNGTYVQPSIKTSPNSTKIDNWSTKGNTNPYTGKAGTKNPY